MKKANTILLLFVFLLLLTSCGKEKALSDNLYVRECYVTEIDLAKNTATLTEIINGEICGNDWIVDDAAGLVRQDEIYYVIFDNKGTETLKDDEIIRLQYIIGG